MYTYDEIATTYTEERERERNRQPKNDDGEEAMTAEEGRKLYIHIIRATIYNFTEKGLCAVEVSRRGQ